MQWVPPSFKIGCRRYYINLHVLTLQWQHQLEVSAPAEWLCPPSCWWSPPQKHVSCTACWIAAETQHVQSPSNLCIAKTHFLLKVGDPLSHAHDHTCHQFAAVESNVEVLTSTNDETTIVIGGGVVLGAVGSKIQLYGLYLNSVKGNGGWEGNSTWWKDSNYFNL